MGILQKTGKFLGVDKFANSMGTLARIATGEVDADIKRQEQDGNNLQKITYALKQEKDPAKKARLQKLAQSLLNNQGATATEIDPSLNYSAKEIYGSGANVALNMLTPGAFKGSKAAVIAKNATLGGAFGAASGLEKNRSASGVVGSAVGGAAIGGAMGAAGLMAKAAKDYMGNKLPEWMMNKAVKPALQDLKKNVKYGSDTLGKELLDEGVKGGPKKLLEIADAKINALEDELQNALTSPGLSEARITKEQIKPYVEDLIATKNGIPGLKDQAQGIQAVWNDLPEEMTLQEANQMKRRIYNELRDAAYKLDAKLGTKASALKQIARGLKTEIENTVGGTVVKDINQKLSIYGRLENSMVDQLAREMRNNGISLTDAILVAGGDTSSILALIRHAGQGIETHTAQALHKLDKVGTGVAGSLTKEVIKKGILNIP